MEIDEVVKFDNKELLGFFVMFVGCDYIEHEKKETSDIHPDFSEDTIMLWEEVKHRMQAPRTFRFEAEKCCRTLRDEIAKQTRLSKDGGCTSSYHYGISSGINIALKVISSCMERSDKE